LDLFQDLRVKPVLSTRLLLAEARKVENLFVKLVVDINNRKVGFVKSLNFFSLINVKPRESIVVTESIIDSLSAHLFYNLFVVLRKVFLKFIAGYPSA